MEVSICPTNACSGCWQRLSKTRKVSLKVHLSVGLDSVVEAGVGALHAGQLPFKHFDTVSAASLLLLQHSNRCVVYTV